MYFLDSEGLFVQKDGDGGDTAHREGTFELRKVILKKYFNKDISIPNKTNWVQAREKLSKLKGFVFCRNPDPNKWYSDPWNFSRDQSVAMVCAMAINNERMPLAKFFLATITRLMFAQNFKRNGGEQTIKVPDWMDPSMWAAFLRGLSPIFYPLICIFDSFLLLSTIFHLWSPINKDGTTKFRIRGMDDVDDDNLNNLLMLSQYKLPTPLSWLSRKIYKKFRQQNYGNTLLGESNPIIGAMMYYHRNNNTIIADIARDIVSKY